MNVGIITFHAVPNYGAVLQLYALIHVLKNLGHSARVIQYCPTDELSGKIKCRSGFLAFILLTFFCGIVKENSLNFSKIYSADRNELHHVGSIK